MAQHLGLILGSAGMQHGIALVQPAWLRDHQVLQRAARQRREAVFDLAGADVHRGRGAMWVYKGPGPLDIDRRPLRRYMQLEGKC